MLVLFLQGLFPGGVVNFAEEGKRGYGEGNNDHEYVYIEKFSCVFHVAPCISKPLSRGSVFLLPMTIASACLHLSDWQ